MSDDGNLPQALDRVLDEQRAFEAHRATRLGRGAEAVTAPIGSVISRLVPPRLVRAALDGADRAAGLTVASELTDHDPDDIASCDAAAVRAQGWAMGLNAASGAGAGWWGGVGLTLDIPASLGIAARNVRATGVAYGFDGTGPDERAFRLAVLELAATGGLAARADAIGRVNRMARILGGGAASEAAREGADWLVDRVVERVARELGVSLARRKAAQIVPLAGAVVAATVNASFQTDVARSARYAYRQRWLAHRRLLPAPEVAE